MTKFVGIGGRLASGKDAISDHLVEKHGWAKLGMSDALAEALYTLNPWIELPTGLGWKNRFTARIARTFHQPFRPTWIRYRDLYDSLGYVRAKEYPEVRRLLQILGTEVGRRIIGESTWTDIVVRRAKEAAKNAPGVIITGIRYPNELDMITDDLEGELWWVVRPSLKDGSNADHSSENSVHETDFDRTIRNDGTLKELYTKIDDIID